MTDDLVKRLNEQNEEIDRLTFQIRVIQGAAAHAQKSYEQHLAVYRQKLDEQPPVWHDDIQSLQERDAIMTDRIEKLEAALQVCVNVLACFERPDFHQLEQKSPIKPYALGALDVARKTLEGKDDVG